MSSRFVHLHVHSEYSIVDSVVRIPELLAATREAGMPAVALTDQGNLFAMVTFYRAALAAGIKPIIGADVTLRLDVAGAQPAPMVLLCRNEAGYANLARLVSRAYIDGLEAGRPVIDASWLEDGAAEGIIALSGGFRGALGTALAGGRGGEALDILQRLQQLFNDDFYIEIMRTGRPGEEEYLASALQLAARSGCPVVATNDVRFLHREDFEAHEARVCIQQGRVLSDPGRPRDYSDQQFLRDPATMAALFADIPEALDNAVEIARRCSLVLELGKTHLPRLEVPGGLDTREFLQQEARRGLLEHLAALGISDAQAGRAYHERLEHELDVICRMGFAGYFLIVADFIQWAKQNQVPVGPGRGSGAGSLCAWALGITELDPIRHSLLFERFLNPERVSMPDFDIDFCMEGRDQVIEYVAGRYGRDKVSQIITYGTMAARAVVRDVGRVLGHPYGFSDRIAKLIPPEPGILLETAMAPGTELRDLYEEDEEVRGVVDLARQLEGLVRNAGKHAGGVVIAPTQITNFAPLYRVEGEAGTVTQFDKDGLEAVGLVKFDFLGLRTLTIIDWAVKTINAGRRETGEAELDISRLPLDDQAAFRLLRSGQTTAVFQLESRGMRDLVKKLKPDSFDDMVALVALFRPGPLQSGMVDEFIARKHGGAEVNYLHPELEPVLRSTYGVIVYQEQVMQIAQVLAGYTLGGADLLRRAMGKKKPAEMAKQRAVFLEGAVRHDVDPALATQIFDLMEKFAEYGFNRSHSAAYALLSWQTAWLKTHYPAAFMAAVLTAEMDDTDKLVVLQRECRALSLAIAPPCVNHSFHAFRVSGERSIRYGLGAIKGFGRGAAEEIVAAREQGGPFSGLHDLCRRIDAQRVGRRALEALIKAGALDELGPNRPSLLAGLELALDSAGQAARARDAGQSDMFGQMPGDDTEDGSLQALARIDDWGLVERLQAEHESLGLYLSGHPFDQYRGDMPSLVSASLEALVAAPAPPPGKEYQASRDVVAAGLVGSLRRRGGRIIVELDDGDGVMEMNVFPETAERCSDLLVQGRIIIATGQLRWDAFLDGWRLNARELIDIDRVVETRATRLLLRWEDDPDSPPDAGRLRELLAPFRPGSCSIQVCYARRDARARLRLGEGWAVRPSRELREQLTRLVGTDGFRFVYETDGLPG